MREKFRNNGGRTCLYLLLCLADLRIQKLLCVTSSMSQWQLYIHECPALKKYIYKLQMLTVMILITIQVQKDSFRKYPLS